MFTSLKIYSEKYLQQKGPKNRFVSQFSINSPRFFINLRNDFFIRIGWHNWICHPVMSSSICQIFNFRFVETKFRQSIRHFEVSHESTEHIRKSVSNQICRSVVLKLDCLENTLTGSSAPKSLAASKCRCGSAETVKRKSAGEVITTDKPCGMSGFS